MPDLNAKLLPVNPIVLGQLLERSKLSIDELAKKSNVSRNTLLNVSDGTQAGLTVKSLMRVAKALRAPITAFARLEGYEKITPEMPDFRTQGGSKVQIGLSVLTAIQEAESIARLIDYISDGQFWMKKLPDEDIDKNQADLAANYRKILKFDYEKQIGLRGKRNVYNFLRDSIENLGIIVLQINYPKEESRGFYIEVEGKFPVICVNSQEFSYGARSFSLIHEFSHHLFRYEGISDPFVTSSNIERVCNSFAANFLMPPDLIDEGNKKYRPSSFDWDRHERFSNWLGVSGQALAIRLNELGMVNRSYVSDWRKNFEKIRSIGERKGQGDYYRNQIARFGYRVTKEIVDAYNTEKIDSIDVFRTLKIKSNNLMTLSDLVSSLTNRGARFDE